MAVNTNNNNNVKKEKQEDLLMTEEQYEIIRRKKTKESVNRVLRVLGLFAAFIIIYIGVLDPFFEISFFGRVFTADTYKAFWGESYDGFGGLWETIAKPIENGGLGIYDDQLLGFGSFLPKLTITIFVVLTVLGLVYLVTFNIIDLVSIIKGMVRATKGISRDLSLNVADGVNEFKSDIKPSTNKKKNIFKGDDVTPEEKASYKVAKSGKTESKKNVRREDTSGLGGLTPEQLDALLLGEDIDVPETTNKKENKNLFED